MMANQSQKLLLILLLERQQLVEELIGRWRPNEAVYVDVHERGHDDLTVESVHEATVAGYTIAKVLDLKGPLETTGEKTAKWPDGGSKHRQGERVYLKRIKVDLRHNPRYHAGRLVCAESKDWGRLAVVRNDARTCLVVLERTYEALEATEHGRENEAEYDGGEGAANKALPCLFGRELDETRATKEEAEHVGHGVIADDEADGQQKPNEALEHVLYHKIWLRDDEQQRQVSVAEKSELFQIVSLLETQHERNEAHRVKWKRDKAMISDKGHEEVVTSQ